MIRYNYWIFLSSTTHETSYYALRRLRFRQRQLFCNNAEQRNTVSSRNYTSTTKTTQYFYEYSGRCILHALYRTFDWAMKLYKKAFQLRIKTTALHVVYILHDRSTVNKTRDNRHQTLWNETEKYLWGEK